GKECGDISYESPDQVLSEKEDCKGSYLNCGSDVVCQCIAPLVYMITGMEGAGKSKFSGE
ncbi:MAG: hypothetical protein LIR25_04765, partial [bacterium]|nr:hypothetical protein [bacterium]